MRTSRVSAVDQVKRRQAFGRQLREALGRAGLRQVDLAKLVGTTQSSVSGWANGRYEPPPPTVFAIELCLGLTPGTLSGTLGYLPVQPDEHQAGIEDVIAWSVDIDAGAKEAIIALYRVSTIRTSRTTHSGNPAAVGTGVVVPGP